MPKNDVLLLEKKLDLSRAIAPSLTLSQQETFFVAENHLKSFRPTHDDVLSGIVDGANDGGIDGIYILANGMFVRDDIPPTGLGSTVDIQLVVYQIKNTAGFQENPIEKLASKLPHLLDLERDEQLLSKRFNYKVIEITRRFLAVIDKLSMPRISIQINFACLRAESEPHPNVSSKATHLEKAISDILGSCSPSTHFLDAVKTLDACASRPPADKKLQLTENPISTDTDTGGYIGVASLASYYKFIIDDNGRLDSFLFESNVRDYDSDSAINANIQSTLENDEDRVDFWWLNNGVTIVADRVQLQNKRLSLLSPQIVNGLQTSHEIYKRGATAQLDERRSVLVKVVEAGDSITKDRIIKATNSQNTLGTSSLRATDRVQRTIEDYFLQNELYYERRRHYYRNGQMPIDKLVSSEQLAQAMISCLALTPEVARSTVSNVFADDDMYKLLFHESHPVEVFLASVRILRHGELYLRSREDTASEIENFLYHLTSCIGIAATRKKKPRSIDIASVSSLPDTTEMDALLQVVRQGFASVTRRKGLVLFEQLAKDPEATTAVLQGMNAYLARPRMASSTAQAN